MISKARFRFRCECPWLDIATLLLQVPLVRDNIEGIWLRDTTSIIHHLEAKYPDKVEKIII